MRDLTSPEAILMLPIAIILDLAGLLLFFFLLDDFGILDVLGMATIGSWILMRSSSLVSSAKVNTSDSEDEGEGEGEGEGEEGEQRSIGETIDRRNKIEENKKRRYNDNNSSNENGGTKEQSTLSQQKSSSTKNVAGSEAKKSAEAIGKIESGAVKVASSAAGPEATIIATAATQLGKKVFSKFGLSFLLEMVPYLGDLYPGWTIIVWKELKK